MRRHRADAGFTLIEAVVAIYIASILIVGVVGLYSQLVKSVKAGREQTIVAALVSEYMEIVRNLPYSQVGTQYGNPHGSLPDQTDPIQTTIESTVYKIYYEVTYIDDPAHPAAGTGSDPGDYKQVKMFVLDTATSVTKSFVTTVVPQGLETVPNTGAISIQVFNASGQPVAGASVLIENTAGTIILNRLTNSSGDWVEVGLPDGVNSYHMVVTKSGYSTDQTNPISGSNPNPTKPDATVANGQVTAVSFSIDLLSNLTIQTLNATCGALSGIGVNVAGSKLIGTNPNVYKYNTNLTSTSGQINLNNFEWDTYTPTLLSSQGWMVLGTSPIQQISVLPNTSQTYTMILAPQTANSLLVIVKDSSSGTALEGALVDLNNPSGSPQDYTAITGGSVWTQNNWSGGSGQSSFVNTSEYYSDDGDIDVSTLPTAVRLLNISGQYVSSGQLISSTFDTGGASNYTTLSWQPTSQNPSTTLEFQLAGNNDNTTWNFVGPDGTSSTYYTVPGSSISATLNGDRYLRYKAFLSTTDNTVTPVLSSIAINYVAGCYTPGQVSFGSLPASNNYNLTVSLSGYQTQTINSLDISGNQILQVLMSQ